MQDSKSSIQQKETLFTLELSLNRRKTPVNGTFGA